MHCIVVLRNDATHNLVHEGHPNRKGDGGQLDHDSDGIAATVWPSQNANIIVPCLRPTEHLPSAGLVIEQPACRQAPFKSVGPGVRFGNASRS